MNKETLNSVQKKHYSKAISCLRSAHQYLCNANGPLPSVDQQKKVWDLMEKLQNEIDKL